MRRDITIEKSYINVKELQEFLLGTKKFFHRESHPRGGCFNGLRTDYLGNYSDFPIVDHFDGLSKLLNLDLYDGYHVDFFAEYHSKIEKVPPIIQQFAPEADIGLIAFLNPDENFRSDITFYSPKVDEFDPYDISNKNNFAVKQSVVNNPDNIIIFDPKEYYSINEWHGEEQIEDGNLNLFITITKKMS